jgi:TP901 family phage tail tape measure protein
MTTDTYSIQVAVDSTSAVTATRNLTAMEQATGRSERALFSLGNMAKAASAALLGIGFKTVISEMASFETKMLQLKSLTDATTQQMKAMEKQARELGATTAFSAQQAAEAQGVLAAAGLKTNEILTATPKVLQLAAAGSLELSRAAEISTETMNGLGLSLKDLGRINDVLAKAAADSSTSVGQIGDAMKTAAPIARLYKISLEEVAAMLEIAAANGLKGAEAGNNLKTIFKALTNDQKDNVEILAKHNLKLKDLSIETIGAAKVLDNLSKAHLSAKEATVIYGGDATALGAILASNSEKFKENTKDLEKANGMAKKMSDDLNQGLAKAFDSLKGTISEAALQLGDSGLKGALTKVIQEVTGVIAIYEGMGDKFAESNNYTKEQYDNLKNVADELKIVAGAAGGIASLTAVIWGANAAMVAFNIATRANPLIMGATVVAAAAGATFAKIADNQSTIDKQIETAEKRIAAMEKYGLPNLIGTAVGFDTEKERTKLTALKQFKEEQLAATKATIDATAKTEKHTEAAKTNTAATADSTDKTKKTSEAKKEAAKAAKDLAEAERYFNEQLNAQVAAAENAGKLFAAQQQTKLAGIEAEKQSIIDKASIEYQHATSYEEKSRILNESQNATNALLAKEKEIRDALTNQSAETIDAKIASAQSELDNAGKYNLTLAEQLRLKTEIAGLQTEKAIIGETASQSDIKAKSDAEKKANDDKIAALKAIDDAQTAANEKATAQMAILTANLDAAKEAATGLSEAFGDVGGAIGGLGVAMASYEKSQAAITTGLEQQLFQIQKENEGKGDQVKKDKAISDANQKQSQLQVKSYGDMTAAAQGFFKKGTAGYNALGVATKVFRAFEMAQSAMSMVRMIADNGAKVGAYITGLFTQTAANTASVAPNVAADATKATASGTAAVAQASNAPFPIGFATGAAMLAFMLAIGVAMAGSGSSAPQMTGADYQKQQSEKYNETVGGTVLGSSEASKSIINSLEIISSNSTADLDYSKGMAESLQKLTYSIDNVTGSVAQQMNFGSNGFKDSLFKSTTGAFGSAGGGLSGIGITAAINMVLPIVGLIMGAFTTVTKITKQFAGSGFKFMNELYENVAKNNTTSVQQYIDILVTETKSSFFGLSKSSRQWITTSYKPIEERVKEAFTDTILGIGNSIIQTADLLKGNTAVLSEQVNNFNIELGRIPMERTNYKGKGSLQKNTENAQINSDRLSAAFQKLSDQMAMLQPQFLESQKIDEGYYQTLMRVTVAISTANSKLKAMGINAIEYSDIVEKRGDIEKQMIVQSLQLASSYTDINDILGKLPGTADDIIDAFKGLNSIKAGLSAIGAGGLVLNQDLINAAGGISKLNNTINNYFDSDYFTKSEKTAFNVKTLTDKFSKMGLLLPSIGRSTESAMASYRDLLDVLSKDTTETGKLIYLKALEMSGDFATAAQDIADIVKTETETATKSFNDAMDYRLLIYKKLGEQDPAAKEAALTIERNKAMEGMTGLTVLYADSLNTLTDASAALTTSQTALETAYKNLTAMRDKFVSLGTGLRTYYDQLTGAQKPQATPLDVYSAAKESFITTALDAKLGKESALSTLPEVSKAFLDASLKYNATGNAYQADYQSVLTALEQGMSAADKQIEIMNAQLREAEKANANLLTVNSSTLTVNTATTNLATALAGYQTTLINYNSAKATAEQILVGINSILKAQDLKTQAERDAAIAAAKANQDALIAQAQTDANKIVEAAQKAATEASAAAKTAQDAATKIANDAAKASTDAAANAAAVLKAAQDLAAKNLADANAAAKAAAEKSAAELKLAQEQAAYQKAVKDAILNVTNQSGLNATTIASLSDKTLIGMSKLLDNVDKKFDVSGITQKDFPSTNLAKSLEIAMSGAITGELSKLTNTQLESLATKSGYDQKQLFDLYSAYSLGYKYGSPEQKILYPDIPAYANGGMASGLSLVGEQGAELVNFSSPANVTSHSQTTGLFDSIGNAIDDQSTLLKEQIIELKALVNLQSNANVALINEMQGMKEELSTISRKAKLEAAA